MRFRIAQEFLNRTWQFFRAYPEKRIFILGKEKSGTTAIAGILGEYLKTQAQLDIPEFWDVEDQIYSGKMPFEKFYGKNKFLFKKAIIKEPGLTYISNNLKKVFPNDHYIMIVRDPRENIRSIYNRLGLSGRIESFNDIDLNSYHKSWQNVLTNRGLKKNHDNPITTAAERWVIAMSSYFKNPNGFYLLRYEDFNIDKRGEIIRMAEHLGILEGANLNDRILNKNFQPRSDKSKSLEEFFGKKNLSTITDICGKYMKKLGYGK